VAFAMQLGEISVLDKLNFLLKIVKVLTKIKRVISPQILIAWCPLDLKKIQGTIKH